MGRRHRRCLLALLASASPAVGQISTYGTAAIVAQATPSVTLSPPPIPAASLLPRPIVVQLNASTPDAAGLAVPSAFFGWSIELSLVPQITSTLQGAFLNYMLQLSNRARSGIVVRVGGNTQDQSTYLPSLGQAVLSSGSSSSSALRGTPNLTLGPELFAVMNNVTAVLGTEWIVGLNFGANNDSNAVLMAATAEKTLGPSLRSLQLGNEPDLLASNGKRPASYSIPDYIGEFGTELRDINSSSSVSRKSTFAAPSVCCDWRISDILADGYLAAYRSSLNAFAVQHYPDNNCAAVGLSGGRAVVPQQVLSNYLNHTGATFLLDQYTSSIPTILAAGLPLNMLETNTASCGGFPGVSDAFVSALWTVDYALQMAARSFSLALFHIGGTSTFYNPFNWPSSSATYLGWQTFPLYYASLVVTEALGSANASRVIDLRTASAWYPGYAIYENNAPSRVVLINYVNDPSGASDYTATINVPARPSSVSVKYLSAPSVVEFANITWAGQTWASSTNGVPTGSVSVQTAQCDAATGTCSIRVPAASVALVFLTDAALQASTPPPSATTALVGGAPTAVGVAASVLATSNGQGGSGSPSGSGDTRGTGACRSVALSAALAPLVLLGALTVL